MVDGRCRRPELGVDVVCRFEDNFESCGKCLNGVGMTGHVNIDY
jgi:hypothetical protein